MPTKKQIKAQRAAIKNAQGNGLVPYGQQKKPTWRKSTNDQLVTVPNFTGTQQGILDKVNQYLSGKGNLQGTPAAELNLPGSQQNSFAPLRNQALKSFHEQTVPLLAERFSHLTNGASSSPLLQSTLGGAGSDLQSQLAALEVEYNLQNQGQQSGNYFNLMNAGLSPQYGVGNIPGQNSGVRSVANGVLNAGLNAGTNYLGGRALGSGISAGLSGLGNTVQQQQNSSSGFNQSQGIGFNQNSPYSFSNAINTNQAVQQGYGQNMLPNQNNRFYW